MKLLPISRVVVFLTLGLLMPLSTYAASLTGVWQGNDGGIYYIRQVNNEVWWMGENSPTSPSFSNVAHGKVDANNVMLSWGDVPKGGILNSGILVLRVVSNNQLQAIIKTGGFGGSAWTKLR